MSFNFVEPWHAFLPTEGGHVIGLMGSGGKTTLLLSLGEFYQGHGVSAVLTTTTRCEVLPDLAALTWDELAQAARVDLPEVVFVHGGLGADGKWQGLSPDQVDALGSLLPERLVLVEVDGAAKKPLKFYREGEPVWPQRTSLALVVIGVGAIGGRCDQQVHRWGRTGFPPLADLPDHALLEWSHLTDLLLEPGGYLDQVPRGVPAVLAMAGLEAQDDSIGLFEFVGHAMAQPALPLAVFCNKGPEGMSYRTVCVGRGEEGM